MGRSQESFHKKEVRKRKEKKRLEKEKKRLERKESAKSSGLDDMIAYVDENGMITDTPPDKTRKKSASKDDIEVSVPRRDPSEPGNKIKSGRLTFFNEIKGYGFIEESETGKNIFVHANDFLEEIIKGDEVNFEIGKGQKGPTAFNVRLLK